jgi:hypothetical protein
MDPQNQISISEKPNQEFLYNRLYRRYVLFFVSTICFLIPIFYQLILSEKFMENNFISFFWVIGFYGYAILFYDILQATLKEIPGKVSIHYKKYEFYYNFAFMLFFIFIGIGFFYVIFGISAVGPIIGGLFVLGIKWWIDNKITKSK